jgi:hypothetical protein
VSAPVKFSVGAVQVLDVDGVFAFAAGMAIDVDGAPNAYHPPTLRHPISGRPPGLDDLRNAKSGKGWAGVVVGRDGKPIVQGPSDPCPGFFVSQTALGDHSRLITDPRRYVDAVAVPYISLPPQFEHFAGLGDLAVVLRGSTSCGAIWADIGPSHRIGEASPAVAASLGLYRGNPNDGHEAADVVYALFPGTKSNPPWPRDDVAAAALLKFSGWGGLDRIRAQFPNLLVG